MHNGSGPGKTEDDRLRMTPAPHGTRMVVTSQAVAVGATGFDGDMEVSGCVPRVPGHRVKKAWQLLSANDNVELALAA